LKHPLVLFAALTAAVLCPFLGVRGLLRDYSGDRLRGGSMAASMLVAVVAGVAASFVVVAILILVGWGRWLLR
jgi:hypothetical protein